MSYLDRLKRKISQNAPGGGATKATKAPFVPFVASRVAPSGQNSSKEAAPQGGQPTEAELQESLREHFEERAAVREYEGGEPRTKAEAEARTALRVYEYRLTDSPSWLVLLAPGVELADIERSLRERFGERFITVRE